MFEPLTGLQASTRRVSPVLARLIAGIFYILAAPFALLIAPVLLSAYATQRQPQTQKEQRLLLSLIRQSAGQSDDLDLSSQGDIDWSSLITLAVGHGIAPQIADILKKRAADLRPPEHILEQLRHSRHQSLFNQLAASLTLREIDTALRGAEIPYAVMKGPYLAYTLYPEDMRTFGDVDILIRRTDVATVAQVLAETHEVASGTGPTGAPRMVGHFHCTLTATKKGRCTIEPHWALVDGANLYRIPEAELFQRLRRVAVGDEDVCVLSLEDDFLYLCLHVTKHALFNSLSVAAGKPLEWFTGLDTGNRLLWLLDIHRFLKLHESNLQWDVVLKRAIEWNAIDDVANCLRVLHMLLPSEPALRALEELGESEAHETRTESLLMRFFFQTRTGEKWLSRGMKMSGTFFFRPARFFTLGQLLFPPPHRLAQYYQQRSAWLLPVLYIIHPFVMARKILVG